MGGGERYLVRTDAAYEGGGEELRLLVVEADEQRASFRRAGDVFLGRHLGCCGVACCGRIAELNFVQEE